jgi:hypothetical protein
MRSKIRSCTAKAKRVPRDILVMAANLETERPLRFQLDQDFLFKYCDFRGIDILQSLRLKVTPPNEFNDPFEFLPKVDFCMDNADVAKWLTDPERLKPIWEQGQSGIPFDEFVAACHTTLGKPSKEQVEQMRQTLQKISLSDPDGVVSFISKTHALACYSEVPDNFLMWSHYTRGHKGVVVEFNLKSEFFSPPSNLMPVSYRSERASAVFDREGFAFNEHALSVVRTKSLAWSYEQEWRQLFELNTCTKVHNPDGTVDYYKAIPADAIGSVMFGVRCQSQTEKIVRELITRPDLKHVRLWRAVLHERDFKLKVVPA